MERKLKIIATVINDVINDQRMIRTCESLAAAGHEVTLIGRRLSETPVEQRNYRQKRLRFILKGGPMFYLAYNLRLFLRLLFSKWDVVHTVDLDTLGAGFLSSRIKGKKLVYDAHEYFTEVPELIGKTNKQKIWKTIERFVVPKADLNITVSQGIADRFTDEYGKPFEVIRNVPNPGTVSSSDFFKVGYDRYILYQGALNKGRGLELLIDSMKDIPLDLVIAGRGDIEKELKETTRNLNLQDRIHFVGMQSPNNLKVLTQQAYIGYNVSENLGFSYYHSLNNKFFDYIHEDLPAITNAYPEYVALNKQYECSIMVDHNRDDIIQAVLLLLNDEQRYAFLKKNCNIAKQELNWIEEEKKLIAAYAQLR
ncbi:MAG: glycosyltransferase [Bacteroidia bacterium]